MGCIPSLVLTGFFTPRDASLSALFSVLGTYERAPLCATLLTSLTTLGPEPGKPPFLTNPGITHLRENY